MPPEKDVLITNWYYIGLDGEIYGPNSSLAMSKWLRTGYFKGNVLIRTENDEQFYSLAEWISNCGNQDPFIFPIVSMNLLIRGNNADSISPSIGRGSLSSGSPSSLAQTIQHFPQPTFQQIVASPHFVAPTPVIILPQGQNQHSFLHIPAGVSSLAFQNNETLKLSSNYQKAFPKTKWYYIGQDGETYGPNSASAMINWYMSGYFGENVLMKTENDECFYPLSYWIINCSNRLPFLFPIVSINALTGITHCSPFPVQFFFKF